MTTTSSRQPASATHVVENQAPPLVYNVVESDPALQHLIAEFAGPAWAAQLRGLGDLAGSAQVREWARLANEHTPQLRSHDRFGNRIDEVEYHPSYHQLSRVAVNAGLHAAPWASSQPGAHAARAAGFYVWSQAEPAHMCPISMTYAAIPALRTTPAVAALYEPLLTSTQYDPGLRVPATKAGLIAGMAMTEKQGGSDVRTNTTAAVPVGDGQFALTGHKWFCSAPMSDVFLMLGQGPDGLTCFAVPRVLPDGSRNPFYIQRLKDKLGNRANASSEIELRDTIAWQVGEGGRGVRTIVEMVSATRVDCVLGSSALMRRAVSEATWHASFRSAFGARLIDQPLMRAVLTDIALEAEAAAVLALRLASTFDRDEPLLRRLALPASKYWVCKRTPTLVAEALECLGGNGYAEESGMPLLYREAPVNSVWEGSGSVNALDVLRALRREPDSLDALLAELADATSADTRVAAVVDEFVRDASTATDADARRLADRIAVALQAALLMRHSTEQVANAFIATRLGDRPANTYGTLPAGVDVAHILQRATPTGVNA
jgi:putative acyl-CoA dehydrogenase